MEIDNENKLKDEKLSGEIAIECPKIKPPK